jgi:hypothetical protein
MLKNDAAFFDGSDPLPIGGVGRFPLAIDSPPKAMEFAFVANVVNKLAS